MSKSWNQKPDGHKPIRKSDKDNWKRKIRNGKDEDEDE